MSWKLKGELLGEYTIEKILGRGGMGEVFRVRRHSDGMRFAVKTLLPETVDDPGPRRLFLRELRTWIDLPAHPHITACRFFRTIEDRTAIFAEYVDGGSLRDWIIAHRCMQLETILDIAIQFAWGLAEAHDRGVIHQDIKPANVLMTGDGVAKITDFGLARALNISGLKPGKIMKSSYVSSSGMTMAYCSPEQAMRQKLNHTTDIWSYGLSVLEMFTGKAQWRIGALAPKILEDYLINPPNESYPSMPETLESVLQKCFADNPEDRWTDARELAYAVQQIYEQETGTPYPRSKPEHQSMCQEDVQVPERVTIYGNAWDDPMIWIKRALKLTGGDSTDLSEWTPDYTGSRKAFELIDLELFEAAVSMVSGVLDSAGEEIRIQFTQLLTQKAYLQEHLGDLSGSLAAYQQGIHLLTEDGDTASLELQNTIIQLSFDRANVIYGMCGYKEAIALFDEVANLCGKRLEATDDEHNKQVRILCHLNRACSLYQLDENQESIICVDKCIELGKTMMDEYSNPKYTFFLSKYYMNRAVSLWEIGEYRRSVDDCDRAFVLMDSYMHKNSEMDIQPFLADIHMNRGNALQRLDKNEAAIDDFDQGIRILESEVFGKDKQAHTQFLVKCYTNKARAIWEIHHDDQVLDWFKRGKELLEQKVYLEGRTEMSGDLALNIMNIGKAYLYMEKFPEAILYFEEAIVVYQHVIDRTETKEHIAYIADCRIHKSIAHEAMGDSEKAKSDVENSLKVLQKELERTGREELRDILDLAREKLARYCQ